MVNSSKCKKEIPTWLDVKGFVNEKTYNREVVQRYASGWWEIFSRSDLA